MIPLNTHVQKQFVYSGEYLKSDLCSSSLASPDHHALVHTTHVQFPLLPHHLELWVLGVEGGQDTVLV